MLPWLHWLQVHQQPNKPVFDTLRPFNWDVFAASLNVGTATLDDRHAESLKRLRVAVIGTSSRRDVVRIHQRNHMVTKIGSKIAKADRHLSLAACTSQPQQKFVPVLGQLRFLL